MHGIVWHGQSVRIPNRLSGTGQLELIARGAAHQGLFHKGVAPGIQASVARSGKFLHDCQFVSQMDEGFALAAERLRNIAVVATCSRPLDPLPSTRAAIGRLSCWPG